MTSLPVRKVTFKVRPKRFAPTGAPIYDALVADLDHDPLMCRDILRAYRLRREYLWAETLALQVLPKPRSFITGIVV